MSDLASLLATIRAHKGTLHLNEVGQVVYEGPPGSLSYAMKLSLVEHRLRLIALLEDGMKAPNGAETRVVKELQPGDWVKLLGDTPNEVLQVDHLEDARVVVHLAPEGQAYIVKVWLWKFGYLELVEPSHLATADETPKQEQPPTGTCACGYIYGTTDLATDEQHRASHQRDLIATSSHRA